jgi:hypothetical protein
MELVREINWLVEQQRRFTTRKILGIMGSTSQQDTNCHHVDKYCETNGNLHLIKKTWIIKIPEIYFPQKSNRDIGSTAEIK